MCFFHVIQNVKRNFIRYSIDNDDVRKQIYRDIIILKRLTNKKQFNNVWLFIK